KIGDIPEGCGADAVRSVAAARGAFDSGVWNNSPPSFRAEVLHRWADSIASEAAALNALDASEMGKPVSESLFDAAAAARYARFYAEATNKITGDVYASDEHTLVAQRFVPRGVVAAIIPWNFPAFNAVLKVAPALAAGNCVVLKPSELSSRSAIRVADLAIKAGLPSGVLNVVPGLGHTVGRALALHDDVNMLTFTGSSEIGKLMIQYAGQSNMKLVLAECGGKSPQIVFDDGVDLDAASDFIARLFLTNQGQLCTAGSRLLVQKSIEEALLSRIISHIRKIVIGDALDIKTTFGPVSSRKHLARVIERVENAVSEGASLEVGGRRVLEESGGYFVEPTIFRNVSPNSRLAHEEIFGPVLAVLPFESESEAIRLANNTVYGLAAYVWTANLSTGMRLAKAIRSSVLINSAAPTGEGAGYAVSSEPTGQSGIGTEGGLAGMQSYLRRQLLWFTHG